MVVFNGTKFATPIVYIDTIADALASTNIAVGDVVFPADDGRLWTVTNSAYTTSDTVRALTGISGQLVLHPKEKLANAAAVWDDTRPNAEFSVGDHIETIKEDFSYEVLSASATDQHGTTAGGVKLHVETRNGAYPIRAFPNIYMDGSTVETTAFFGALDAIQGTGGGEVLIDGVVRIDDNHNVGSNGADWTNDITLRGSSADTCEIRCTATDKGILTTGGVGSGDISTAFNLTLEKLTFRGYWTSDKKEGASISESSLFHLIGLKKLVARDCVFRESQFCCLRANVREGAFIENNVFDTSVRDCCAIWSSGNVQVIGNRIQHCNDDGISVHVGSESTIAEYGIRNLERIVITGNILKDSQGIVVIGARNLVVSGNIGTAIRSRFILVRPGAGSFDLGRNSYRTITISDNQCTDLLRSDVHGGTGDINDYLVFIPYRPNAGSLDAIPELNVAADPSVQSPFGQMDDDSATGTIAPAAGILIDNNVFMRTKSAGDYETQFGFQTFQKTGFNSPTLTLAQMMGVIKIGEGMVDWSFTNNIIKGAEFGIQFLKRNETGVGWLRGRIANNRIIYFTSAGIGTDADDFLTFNVDIVDNYFDGDPYHVHAERGASGTWTALGDLYALNLNYLTGARLRGNTFANVSQTHFISSGRIVIEPWNYVIGKMVDTAFSTSNEGVGSINELMGGPGVFAIIDTEQDPAETGFHRLQADKGAYSSVPTSGYWLAGEFVPNADRSGVNARLTGWTRITTGNSNTNLVDWWPKFIPGEVVSQTSGELGAASGPINTTSVKQSSLLVWNTTTSKMMAALGNGDTDDWSYLDGSGTITPT